MTDSFGDPRTARVAVLGLVGASLMDAVGATMVLPILPVFLRHGGASYAEIGLVTAVFWGAGLAVRYPLGLLSDRLGRKWLIAGSQVVYALATAAFALSPSPVWFVVFRAVQGAASGAAMVISMAAVADFVPPQRRGRAYGWLSGTQMGGTVVGPLIGAAAAQVSFATIFLGSAGAVAIEALIILATLPRGRPQHLETPPGHVAQSIWTNRVILGILASSIAIGVLIGMYDTDWSLLMHARHASNFEIGLSFTVFALPFAVASWPAGWIADHFDNRWLIGISTVTGGAFAATYPFLPTPAWLIALGFFEGLISVAGVPARQALLSHQVAPREMGKLQGVYGSVQVGGSAAAALLAGPLFGVNLAIPFLGTAGVMFLAALTMAPLWAGTSGRPPAKVEGPAPLAPGPPPTAGS